VWAGTLGDTWDVGRHVPPQLAGDCGQHLLSGWPHLLIIMPACTCIAALYCSVLFKVVGCCGRSLRVSPDHCVRATPITKTCCSPPAKAHIKWAACLSGMEAGVTAIHNVSPSLSPCP
jgi:hypothetical protein